MFPTDLKKNLPLKFGYFHFSVTASFLPTFVSAEPRQTILLIDRSEPRFENHTGGKIRKTLENIFVNLWLNKIQNCSV